MPKTVPSPHFDVVALLTAVHQQDVGLRVSTNNPAGWRRILYEAMRANPLLRCFIYADPRAASAFYIVKTAIPTATAIEEDEE
jgi:hypothetical protein